VAATAGMTYAFFYDVPGTEELYQRVKAALGDDPPKGQVAHLVVKVEGGLRHFNVWESEEDWARYRDQRVGPAVGEVLATAASASARPRRSSSPWTWSTSGRAGA
jgi:hypothetical protein